MDCTCTIDEFEVGDKLYELTVELDFRFWPGLAGDRENPPEPAEVEVTNTNLANIKDENGVDLPLGDEWKVVEAEFKRLNDAGVYEDRFYDRAGEYVNDNANDEYGGDDDHADDDRDDAYFDRD